jgi:dihydrofolate synthase/folylpolyglutamate synthase
VRRAFAGATAPGRLEVVGRHPLIVLDGAHNPAAAEALAAALPEAFVWDRLRAVVGVFSNKDLEGIAGHVAPLADEVYACATASVRARPPREVADAFSRRGVAAQAFADVRVALDAARADASEGDLILVTGSLYTVADARRALVAGPPPEVRGPGPAEEEP